MDTWQTILLAIGGNAALLAVLGWLAKSSFQAVLNRDSKKFEYELKAKSDAAIEQLRSQLELQAIEHHVRFSSFHRQSAKTIAQTYALLQKYLQAVAQYISIFDVVDISKLERREEVVKAITYLDRFFCRNIPRIELAT